MKRLLFILAVLVTTFHASAYETENPTFESDGIRYEITYDYDDDDPGYHDKRSCKVIPGSDKLVGDIEIPSFVTYNGKSYFVGEIWNETFMNMDKITSVFISEGVVLIGEYAFRNCTELTAVSIPTTVTDIWAGAFDNCAKLTEINLPDGIERIEKSTFAGCTSLETMYIPSTVTYIGDQAFVGCENLVNVISTVSLNLPESVTYIGEKAFAGCEKWRLSIPASLTYIGDWAFSNCLAPSSITIPGSVTYIGDFSFYFCSGLQKIHVDSENQNYSSIDGVLFNKEVTHLVCYPHDALQSEYTLPETVTEIPQEAFIAQYNLTALTMHSQVTEIMSRTFWDCTNLNTISLPETLVSIGDNAFLNCESLSQINIPDAVITIGEHAFRNCQALESVVFPNSLDKIEPGAFWNCQSLTSVDIPEGTHYLGYNAFLRCKNLKTVTLPASLIPERSSIHFYYETAFYECDEIEDVYYKAETPVELPDNLFSQTTYEKAILHVPAAALEKAAVTLPWSQFKNIKSHDFSNAVGDITADADPDAPIEVYNFNGIKVADSTDSLPTGLYIVRQGATVKKIAVK